MNLHDDGTYVNPAEPKWPLWFMPIFIIIIIGTYVLILVLDFWQGLTNRLRRGIGKK